MKTFKEFCEQAFHPDLVNKLSNLKVQKNLRSTVIPQGQKYASGPPPISQKKKDKKKPLSANKNLLRYISTATSPL